MKLSEKMIQEYMLFCDIVDILKENLSINYDHYQSVEIALKIMKLMEDNRQ